MYTCANCTIHACKTGQRDKMPQNCPMRDPEFFERLLEEYEKPENHDFFVCSSAIEAMGYCQWPRPREAVVCARRMGYARLGIGFCSGLRKEAAIVDRVLRSNGFEVVSVICKAGGIPKKKVGVTAETVFPQGTDHLRPVQLELLDAPMCNPIAQAQLLNKAGTQLNICLGLCVGHDSLFYKYSQAPVTTLVAKDRVTGHNPAAAICYADTYFADRLKGGSL